MPSKVKRDKCVRFDDGVWRSWLARRVWDAEVEGSSPFTPTNQRVHQKVGFLIGLGLTDSQGDPHLAAMLSRQEFRGVERDSVLSTRFCKSCRRRTMVY